MSNGILKKNYHLVWSDFFLTSHLDTNKWNVEIREPGWVNNELQAYTNKIDNIYLNNNKLTFQGLKEKYNGADYTSARINTSGKSSWKYGKFEIRAKLPMQKGLWSAIWLLNDNIKIQGWPECGEIDIMEHFNDENIIYATIHTSKYNYVNNNQIVNKTTLRDLNENFHIYGLEWNSESIIWLVDNRPFHRINKKDYFDNDWPFDNNFFLIINQAIGGFLPGDPLENFTSSHFIVDWVKVYQ